MKTIGYNGVHNIFRLYLDIHWSWAKRSAICNLLQRHSHFIFWGSFWDDKTWCQVGIGIIWINQRSCNVLAERLSKSFKSETTPQGLWTSVNCSRFKEWFRQSIVGTSAQLVPFRSLRKQEPDVISAVSCCFFPCVVPKSCGKQ